MSKKLCDHGKFILVGPVKKKLDQLKFLIWAHCENANFTR